MGNATPGLGLELHHVAIGVADVSRVAAFYRDVLGLPEAPRPSGGSGDAVWLRAGETILMIESGPPAAPRALVLAIPSGERDAWRARLSSAARPGEVRQREHVQAAEHQQE